MENTMYTWQPPVVAYAPRPRTTPGTIVARILGTLLSGPAVLISALLGPAGLLLALCTASAIGYGLGQTYEPRSRVGASIAHALFAVMMAIGLLVVLLIIALSQYHGEVF
jgi:hypothetical protein